jgi:hypothetical protein
MNDKVKDALAGADIDKTGTPAVLTAEILAKMLIDTQKELAKSQQAMADAILESRKPYVDPKVLEQKKKDLEDRQKMIQADQRERIARKKICPHVRENGTGNIKWMSHSNNIILGVCGSCFSQFDTRNPGDLALLRADLKSQKNMGRAGEHARIGAVITA